MRASPVMRTSTTARRQQQPILRWATPISWTSATRRQLPACARRARPASNLRITPIFWPPGPTTRRATSLPPRRFFTASRPATPTASSPPRPRNGRPTRFWPWETLQVRRKRSLPLPEPTPLTTLDRKSTRLNSSHRCISYAVFCLKKRHQQHHYHFRLALAHFLVLTRQLHCVTRVQLNLFFFQ